MKNTALNRFRVISVSEGISYMILLFVAMPMKYVLNMPWAVKITGWAHGALFIVLVITLIDAMMKQKWSIIKAGMFFIASLIPFAAFLVEIKWLSKEVDLEK